MAKKLKNIKFTNKYAYLIGKNFKVKLDKRDISFTLHINSKRYFDEKNKLCEEYNI